MVILHSLNKSFVPAPISTGQRDGRDVQWGKTGQLLALIRPVFVDAQRSGKKADDSAAGRVQSCGAPVKAGRIPPRLHGAVEKQRETGVRQHGR
jgi:hypothetical protein